ncbi:hypothetical protein T492DRAFT_1077337 [Pavlovales sp. CCMP2436]|nr:hypothetical protein T492DRAFT_1077337 [Pavlovales sp. CCMP2436]
MPAIVIIPIYWKAQKEDKIRVITAANAVHAALRAADVICEIDMSFELTPGQKFAAWEFKGVMSRVEVGPRDADQGTCTLARTDVAGKPARRKTGVSTRADMLVPAVRALIAGSEDAELADYAGPVMAKVEKAGKRRTEDADGPVAEVTAEIARPGATGDDLEMSAPPASKAKRARSEVKF